MPAGAPVAGSAGAAVPPAEGFVPPLPPHATCVSRAFPGIIEPVHGIIVAPIQSRGRSSIGVGCGSGVFVRFLWWEDSLPAHFAQLWKPGSRFVLLGGLWRDASAGHGISIAVPTHAYEWQLSKALSQRLWGLWVVPVSGPTCELAWSGPAFARWHALTCTLQTFFSAMQPAMRSGVCSAPVQSCTLGLRASADGAQWVDLPPGALPVVKLLRDLLQADPRLAGKISFTSLQVNRNVQTRMHIDGANSGEAFLCSVGQFEGGMLWCYDPAGTHFQRVPPDAGVGLRPFRGALMRGSLHETRHRFVSIRQNLPHATMPWQGERWSLVMFTRAPDVEPRLASTLRGSGFPLAWEDAALIATQPYAADAMAAAPVIASPRTPASAIAAVVPAEAPPGGQEVQAEAAFA